jgi:uncharacterized protein (TIGR00730 family)
VTTAIRNVCVFCGARDGNVPAFRALATELGGELVKRGLGLVYGGAALGLMGALADAVLAGGGPVRGVIPHGLAQKEFAHPRVKDVHFVDSMHERKALMEKSSDAFIAMPGGFGTLDELFEIVTWSQVGLHRKPIGLLNPDGYFDGLLQFRARAVKDGFISAAFAEALVVETTPQTLLERLLSYVPPPPVVQWIRKPAP